ncbi:uncharacterized protein [Henckelia pumila]|uniref:uncharacterized protein isoform X2 n=1 Tax=Henckelia pumila TaxID=405737 RepID=UPI003C6E58F2
MPPKLSSAQLPRRTRAAAGTSIPRATRKSNHHTPLAADTAAVSAPPSTKPLTSPEASKKSLHANTSIIKSSSDQSAVPTPLSESQFSNLEKAVAGNLGLVKPGNSVIDGTDNADKVTFVEPEKACSLEIETVVGSGHGVTSEHILSYGQDERSFGPTDGPESRESGVVVPGHGKKKIVKRTVRVVRRVIRKIVPKRVLMDGSENQKNGVILNEESKNLNLRNDFIESSNLYAMEKCNLVNEMNDKANTADEMAATANFNIGASVLEPMIDKECNDLLAVRPTDMDKLKGDDVLARGGTMRVPDLMEVEKVNSAAESTLKSDRTNGMDDPNIENVNSAGESAVQSGLTAGVEDSVIDTLEENLRVDEAKSGDADEAIDQMVHSVEQACASLLGDQNEPLMGNTSGGKYEGEVKFSEDLEGKNVPSNKGLLLSGELEALERKKRRKTEIFVGGLNKDAKEGDLWKAFDEAGEILQVRLAMNNKTGKNKGFAFVQFATAADAKNALEKYSKVEICGSQCDAAPVEGNDTIFLGNIDRKWKTEDVVRFLEKAGVDKIEVVTLKTNPENLEMNRGFAFVEFETNKDAQIAFHKLKKKDILGQNQKIKIAWAQPLTEPSEEEILNVKSVYAEYLPPSWDEEKVREHFKRFGEIENIVLAKDLASSRRKDFAFINYSTRDGALACIEAVSRERIEHSGSKVKIAVSLANPIPKSKQQKTAYESASQQFSLEKPKVLQATMKFHDSRNKGKAASSNYDVDKFGHRSSTTDELVQILRQQASSKYVPPRPIAGNSVLNHFPLHGSKRPLSLGGTDQLFLEPRALPRARIESYSISDPSFLSHGVGTTSFPYHRQVAGHTSEPAIGSSIYPRFFQTREQAPYNGNIHLYRRY